jgi:hypothetical protein
MKERQGKDVGRAGKESRKETRSGRGEEGQEEIERRGDLERRKVGETGKELRERKQE